MYVGITVNLFTRTASYSRADCVATTMNRSLVAYLKKQVCIVEFTFEKELWKREIAETFFIHTLKPLFNIAKVAHLASSKDITVAAKEYIGEKTLVTHNDLYNFLSSSFSSSILDDFFKFKLLHQSLEAFVLEDSYVSKDFVYQKTLDNILDRYREGVTEVNLKECVPFGLLSRVKTSSKLRDRLKSCGLEHIGYDIIAKVAQEPQIGS